MSKEGRSWNAEAVLRGMAWSAGEPVDRFNELATIGARVETD